MKNTFLRLTPEAESYPTERGCGEAFSLSRKKEGPGVIQTPSTPCRRRALPHSGGGACAEVQVIHQDRPISGSRGHHLLLPDLPSRSLPHLSTGVHALEQSLSARRPPRCEWK